MVGFHGDGAKVQEVRVAHAMAVLVESLGEYDGRLPVDSFA